jgi:gliding motility-associated lipoprotein GldD
MKMKLLNRAFLFTLVISVVGCTDYSPKPKAYPRVMYPTRDYQEIVVDCPYEFEIPVYSELKAYGDKNRPCWYNLTYPQFDATLHCSYIQFTRESQLDSLREDAYKLALNKHHIERAEEIIEREFSDTATGLTGMIYDLQGKTATPFNFFVTDKKNHFFRGSFYFNTKTDLDSVAPVYNFLREDIMHTINTFKFN